MKTFRLERSEDPSGVSGIGFVAEGCELHDGQTVVSWYGQYHSLEVHPSMESVIKIHGHDGKTKVRYD